MDNRSQCFGGGQITGQVIGQVMGQVVGLVLQQLQKPEPAGAKPPEPAWFFF